VPWSVLSQSYDSGVTSPRNVVVRDAASLQALWGEMAAGWDGPAPPAPAVDFSSRMVVGVFLGTPWPRGTRPCSVAITDVRIAGSAVTVSSVADMTCRAPATYSFSGPYCLAVCPASSGPVTFQQTIVASP
jgi:hypothetical protein